MKKLWAAAAVLTAVTLGTVAAGSGASATPPTGNPDLPSGTVPVVGTLDAGTLARQDGISLRVRRDTTVRTFTLTYPIGSSSGWHRHPGIVLAVVQQGTVVRQVGCRRERFTVGDSFTEVAPHRISNRYREADQPGAAPAVLSITQLFPAGTEMPRVEEPAPRCS